MVAEIVDGTPMSARGGRRERRLRRPVFRPVSAERSTAGVTGRMDGRSSTSPNSDFGKDILVPDVTGERAPARGGVPESIFCRIHPFRATSDGRHDGQHREEGLLRLRHSGHDVSMPGAFAHRGRAGA